MKIVELCGILKGAVGLGSIVRVILVMSVFFYCPSFSAFGSLISTIGAGRNADGRLELFYINSDSSLCHRWQISPGEEWSKEAKFANSAKGVVVESDANGCLHVFFVGLDDRLYLKKQTAPNNGWSDSVEFDDSVKAVFFIKDASDLLHLFYTCSDDTLYHRWQTSSDGVWTNKTKLTDFAKVVAVGLNEDSRLEVFFCGSGDTLYHKWETAPGGAWSNENQFAASPAKTIAVSQNADGRLEVFFTDKGNVLYHKWQIAPNSSWDNHAIFAGHARFVKVGQNSDGRMEVLYTEENDILHKRCQIAADSAWYPEEQFGWTAENLAVMQNADGRLEVFYMNTEKVLFHNWQLQPGMFWAGEYPIFQSDQELFIVEELPQSPIYEPSQGNWHVNDHCFIEAQYGKWHMFGIVWPDPGSGDPTVANYFGHAAADSLEQLVWEEKEPPFYETLEGGRVLWAPHIILYDNIYYMYYCNGGDVENYAIVLRTSEDLVTWSDPLLLFTDGYQGRDPMVRWCSDENRWIMYYTATEYPTGGNFVVACRTSEDLMNWSSRKIVYTDYHRGTGYGPTESPFVVQRGDFYYLFIGPRPYDPPTEMLPNWEHPGYVGTDVFCSDRWDYWTNADYIGHINAHAPEIIQDEVDNWFVSHAGVKQGGLFLTEMTWLDSLSTHVPYQTDEQTMWPHDFRLLQNYPNPFNVNTYVSFRLENNAHINISVFDIAGRRVKELLNDECHSGVYELLWNGTESRGIEVSSGIYFCKMRAGDQISMIKMILLR